MHQILVTIHRDSMAAISHTKNTRYHEKTKHKEVKFNFKINRSEEVILEYILLAQKPITLVLMMINSYSYNTNILVFI